MLLAGEAALEAAARDVRIKVLEVLASHNVRPDVAAMALADALALNAAIADLDRGEPRGLEARLDALCARVEGTYRRAYRDMGARRARTAVCHSPMSS